MPLENAPGRAYPPEPAAEDAVPPIAGLPRLGPVNLDEALAGACEGVAGIGPAQFRALLSPEDVADIEAGGIHPKILKAYALSFANHGGAGEANNTSQTSPHGRAGLRDIPDDAFLLVNPVLMAGVKNELGRPDRGGGGKLNL